MRCPHQADQEEGSLQAEIAAQREEGTEQDHTDGQQIGRLDKVESNQWFVVCSHALNSDLSDFRQSTNAKHRSSTGATRSTRRPLVQYAMKPCNEALSVRVECGIAMHDAAMTSRVSN